MLRFHNASHDVTIPAGLEPPRPTLRPRARVLARPPTRATASAMQYDSGREPDVLLRFVSSDRQGIIPADVAEALIAMYEEGGSFTLTTDLTVPLGQPSKQYACLWAENDPPRFTPATPDGANHYMDILVRATEV